MNYSIISIVGDIITIELSTPQFSATKYTHRLFVNGDTLQATHEPGKEFKYKKRG
jgi:hypothetical protein